MESSGSFEVVSCPRVTHKDGYGCEPLPPRLELREQAPCSCSTDCGRAAGWQGGPANGQLVNRCLVVLMRVRANCLFSWPTGRAAQVCCSEAAGDSRKVRRSTEYEQR
jgi:hypothetical protein